MTHEAQLMTQPLCFAFLLAAACWGLMDSSKPAITGLWSDVLRIRGNDKQA